LITVDNIIDEINRLMVTKFPSALACVNLIPVEFTRPAYLITCEKFDCTDASRHTVAISSVFSVIYFGTVDEYQQTNTTELSGAQATIMDLFKEGYITVGDRKIKCRSSRGRLDFDAAYIDVQFEYFDDRTDTTGKTPLMAAVTTTLQEG